MTDLFVEKARETFANMSGITNGQIKDLGRDLGMRIPWKEIDRYRTSRTSFSFIGEAQAEPFVMPERKPGPKTFKAPIVPITPETSINPEVQSKTVEVSSMTSATDYLIPIKDPLFVPFGVSSDLNKIIRTGEFLPIYITGESGIGKTLAVVQSCAKHHRELIRFNVNQDTDESDLFGDFFLSSEKELEVEMDDDAYSEWKHFQKSL